MSIILKMFSNFRLYLQPLLNMVSTQQNVRIKKHNNLTNPEAQNQQQYEFCFNENGPDYIKLSSREIKMVIERLGIVDYEYGNDDGESKVQESLCAEEVWKVFEEKEPSVEEVKEAFDVFDGNQDGFIDAAELQRVLCSLGLKEVSEIEQCKRMIRAADENGDGLIEFDEFVKFMEKCFS